jgi:hypothetical protein
MIPNVEAAIRQRIMLKQKSLNRDPIALGWIGI